MQPLGIPDELAGQPFTVATARAAGLSWKVLQGQRFVCLGRGAYMIKGGDPLGPSRGSAAGSARRDGDLSEASLIHGALLTLPPQTLVTGVSGLRLLGVMVGSPGPLCFVTTHPRQVRRQGVRVTRVTSLPAHHGSVTVAEHCWVAAARDLTLLDLVTAGDWLLRERLTTLPALQAYVESTSIRGVGSAREAIGLVREQVDSARETWLRLCLVFAGLPTPQCNPTVQGVRRYGRVDLTYLKYRVLIEYEGDQHRGDNRQWNRDIDRYDDFVGASFTVIRITAERARYPRLVARRVYEALCAGGYRGPEPAFDQRWMALFEK
jgi:hypothetical protein